jgi:hypothetical protein
MNAIYELIVPLEQVPDESNVRKITGEKTYTVKRDIKIYTNLADAPNKEIECATDCVFLIDDRANISMEDKNKKVVWIVDIETLHAYLSKVIHDDFYT